jgi:diguanylate cyclase (GGDEF)-like protein
MDRELGEDLIRVLEESVGTAAEWVKRARDEGYDEGTKLADRIIRRSKRRQEEIRRRDPQTGFYNSVYFRQEFVPGILKKLATDRRLGADRRDQLTAFWYLDLDNLKFINTLLSHKSGDELFRRLSWLFRKDVREKDDLEVGRLGGQADEFGVIQKQVKNAEEVRKYALRIKNRFRKYAWTKIHPGFEKIPPGVSIGVAVVSIHSLRQCPKDTDWLALAEQWQTAAEQLMMESKKSGDVILHGFAYADGQFVRAELPDYRRLETVIART